MTVRSCKIGAAGRAYTATGQGHSIRVAVQQNGYKLTVQTDLNYAAMTDRQAQAAHGDLYTALTEALADASNRRRCEVPLFELDDLQPTKRKPEGINSL